MIRHLLTGDLATALAERQAAFVAGDAEETWVLPPGEHVLAESVSLGAPGRRLALIGAGLPAGADLTAATLLHFDAGGLFVEGDWLRLSGFEVRATAADLAGGNGAAITATGRALEIAGMRCSASASTATALVALADEEVVVTDFAATDVAATERARGLFVRAPAVELTSIEARGLTGASVDGVVAIALSAGSLLALDVTARDLEATLGMCRGIVTCSGGTSSVRGFSLGTLTGAVVHGLVSFGMGDLTVTSGTIADLHATVGGAVGARVLLGEFRAAFEVSDISVSGIGGTDPVGLAFPHPDVGAWGAQIRGRFAIDATLEDVPAFPSGDATREIVGVHVGVLPHALDAVWSLEPHAVRVDDLVVQRVAGTALEVETGLRAAELRRIELWMCARPGGLQAENLLLAEATLHEHLEVLRIGPGNVRVFNVLCSGSLANSTPVLEEEAELETVRATFVTGATSPWVALEGQPYVLPGPAAPASLASGVVPPGSDVDLSLAPDSPLVNAGVIVDGEGPAFVGARAPNSPLPCHLDDPEPRVWREAEPAWPADPAVNYRARDATSLLEVMTERARVTMPSWTAGDASDMTQMLFELLAERLDHVSYRQERAVAEGFLPTARLRRSVEDHARALDYRADLGLSASAMLRFQVDAVALARALDAGPVLGVEPASALRNALNAGRPVEIAEGTLVGNEQPEERSIVFATEELLSYLPELDISALAQTLPIGGHSARLVGRFERLERGRWLVISRGPTVPGLVVRVTEVQLETDTTFVTWDPRRASLHDYPQADEPDAALVFGNVVPAHHGLPIDARYEETAASSELDRALERWNALLSVEIDGATTREFELPLRPSIQARGYPFSNERRAGQRVLRIAVSGDPWREVDDLSLCGPSDEVYCVRAGVRGLPVVRFGDGQNGAALPARKVHLQLELSVGGGAAGNVGAQTLRQILRFGRAPLPASDPEALILPTAGPERSDLVQSIWKVTNPLPAVGGRDPEALESIRYRAPLGVRDALSAVTPRDYEVLLLRLPFVAGARARVHHLGPREVVQVTVLLRDEDTLPEAELMRRWAVVRRTLEEIRLLGFDVEAVPPVWVPLDLDLVVEAGPHSVQGHVRTEVTEALAGNGGFFDPDRAGLGGDVRLSDLYDTVQRVNGVRSVRVLRFRRLARGAVEHLADGVIPIGDHEVATIGGSRTPGQGLMTLTVCGGLA